MKGKTMEFTDQQNRLWEEMILGKIADLRKMLLWASEPFRIAINEEIERLRKLINFGR